MKRATILAVAFVVLGCASSACAQPDFEGLGVAYAGPAPQQAPAQFPAQVPSQLPPSPEKLGAFTAPQEPQDASWFDPAPRASEQPRDAPTHPRNSWNRRYYGHQHRFNQGGSWNHARWYDYQGYHAGWGYAHRPIYQRGWYVTDRRYGWDPRPVHHGWGNRYAGYNTSCYW